MKSLVNQAEISLVTFVSYIVVDFITHGLIIDDFFWGELEEVARTGSEIKYIPLIIGMGYAAVVFSYFIQSVPKTLKHYFVFGAFLGSLFIVPYHLVNYAFFYNYSLQLVVIDSIVSVFEFGVVGACVYEYLTKRGKDLRLDL